MLAVLKEPFQAYRHWLVPHRFSIDGGLLLSAHVETPVNVVEFRGKRVDPRDVQFALLSNEKMPGVRLFIPGYQENDSDLKTIGYLLLDESLGEYDVESRLGLIEMLSPNTRTDGQRHLFSDLPRRFDELVASLWPTIEK